jgi:hypothetical protein
MKRTIERFKMQGGQLRYAGHYHPREPRTRQHHIRRTKRESLRKSFKAGERNLSQDAKVAGILIGGFSNNQVARKQKNALERLRDELQNVG